MVMVMVECGGGGLCGSNGGGDGGGLGSGPLAFYFFSLSSPTDHK